MYDFTSVMKLCLTCLHFQIYPRPKAAEFDAQGRPFHPFFYTTRPVFTQTLFDVVSNTEACIAVAEVAP